MLCTFSERKSHCNEHTVSLLGVCKANPLHYSKALTSHPAQSFVSFRISHHPGSSLAGKVLTKNNTKSYSLHFIHFFLIQGNSFLKMYT